MHKHLLLITPCYHNMCVCVCIYAYSRNVIIHDVNICNTSAYIVRDGSRREAGGGVHKHLLLITPCYHNMLDLPLIVYSLYCSCESVHMLLVF